MKYLPPFAAVLIVWTLLAPAGSAQQLIYRPLNPAFGGSPLNYQWLVQSAQLQNPYDDQDQDDFFNRDPLSDFEDNLQRQLLSQLSRELVFNRFGDIDLTREGRFDLGEFVVEVVPGLNGIEIKVFNVLTGEESTVTVPSL